MVDFACLAGKNLPLNPAPVLPKQPLITDDF
jgi:hypothetical protein